MDADRAAAGEHPITVRHERREPPNPAEVAEDPLQYLPREGFVRGWAIEDIRMGEAGRHDLDPPLERVGRDLANRDPARAVRLNVLCQAIDQNSP